MLFFIVILMFLFLLKCSILQLFVKCARTLPFEHKNKHNKKAA